MEDLRVLEVQDGALIVSGTDGTQYRLAVDSVLQSRLRQSRGQTGAGPKLAPREVQAHIRAGMSAQDVANVTGADLEYILRFEGPVMAEREFVIKSAQGVAVHVAGETDSLTSSRTFGSAIHDRLAELGAVDEHWASWKDPETGWVVKLAFTASDIGHDARWQFDPKRQSLAPLNNEAKTLSQQGEVVGALIPRLRAVASVDNTAEAARFDSGAFDIDDLHDEPASIRPAELPVMRDRTAEAGVGNQTADLLDALRRRRGEREPANFDAADDEEASSTSHEPSMRLLNPPAAEQRHDAPAPPQVTAPQPTAKSRKRRVAMPSWDDIVFGTKPDDDPA
ncbi:septation protein SepH [Salinibacterium sp. PAMC 21357]|uniref:septation protein SepH n=1 Tax=Salinibacterium sp. PAMC 21357 TaxID=1112215 RepID=UPI000287F14B|nr:septation protein SepH [Salinibacterium sp. PAMC 21357]